MSSADGGNMEEVVSWSSLESSLALRICLLSFFNFFFFYQVRSLTKLFILMMKYYFGCLLATMFLLQMKHRVIWAIQYTVNWSQWLGYFFHLATCVVLRLSCLAAVPRLSVVETGLFQVETGRFQMETGRFQGLWITKSPHPPFFKIFFCLWIISQSAMYK